MKSSICIPAYEMKGKGRDYLTILFRSIQAQTSKDYEVIVSDHSTNEMVRALCEEWATTFTLTYLPCTAGRGNASININNALRHASGDIIKPMHQDDFFRDPTCLEQITAAFARNPDLGWGACGFIHTNEGGQEFFHASTPRYSRLMAEAQNTIGAPSVVFFKNDRETFFDEALIWMNDAELYYRLHKKHGSPAILRGALIAIRQWPEQVSNVSVTRTLQEREIGHTLAQHGLKPDPRHRLAKFSKRLIRWGWQRCALWTGSRIRYLYQVMTRDEDVLSRLSNKYRSDKGTRKILSTEGDRHFYAPIYERHFRDMRRKDLTVLEIGIGSGASIDIWRDYFPHADLHFIDIDDFSHRNTPRIHCHRADQSSRDDLRRVVQTVGKPFDIIIDDGGHYMNQQQISFGTLFPHLKPGGMYFIEDLHTSYWPFGRHVAVYDDVPIDTNADKTNTTLAMLRALAERKQMESLFLTATENAEVAAQVERCLIYDTAMNSYGPNHLALVQKRHG